MDEIHKKMIRTNRSFVVNNLHDVRNVADVLLEKDILTESMVQDIMAEKTAICQVRRLLDILPKRGPFAFSIFCNVLIQTKYRYIAEKLDPTLVNSQTSPLDPGTVPQQPHPQPVSVPKHRIEQSSRGSCPQSGSVPSKKPSNPVPKQEPLPNPTGFTEVGSKPSEYKPELGRQLSRDVSKTYAPSDQLAETISSDWPQNLNLELFGSKHFDVEPCSHEDLKTQLNDTESYPIESIKRGRAVIINNRTFKDDLQFAERGSSDNDSFRFSEVLKKLGFRIINKINFSKEEIMQLLEGETKQEQQDIFMLVILSYGGAGTILCHDGEEIMIQDVVNMFSATNCPALSGKPKLFFIQACGTKMKDYMAEAAAGDVKDVNVDSIKEGLENLTLGPPEGDMTDTRPGSTSSEQLILEDTRDILVAMATIPDQTSDHLYNSLFILSLSFALSNYARKDHLLQILDRVNKLKYDQSSARCVKLCEIKHSLTNKLYFLPGYAPSTANYSAEEFSSELPSFGDTQRT